MLVAVVARERVDHGLIDSGFNTEEWFGQKLST